MIPAKWSASPRKLFKAPFSRKHVINLDIIIAEGASPKRSLAVPAAWAVAGPEERSAGARVRDLPAVDDELAVDRHG